MTKVMATLTREQCADAFLVGRLRQAGMEGVRINSAHVTPDELRLMVADLRRYAPGVAVLMDTKGPELRTAANEGGTEIELREGAEVAVENSGLECSRGRVCIPAPGVAECLTEGVELTVDDGEVCLRMVSPGRAVVTKGGVLGERKSVVMHGCEMPALPAVSDRDRANLHAAAELEVEMVAHSFVRSAEDIAAVRRELGDAPVRVLAKVETAAAVREMEKILAECDGLLMARGDLGTQISPYEIPVVQERCAALCSREGKEMIVATQILQSMMENPAPTRAEITDMATGVRQGAEYLLLCGETARGRYPVQCVEAAAAAIAAAEPLAPEPQGELPSTHDGDPMELYIHDHISPEPELLARLFRHTCLHRLYPRMCSGHVQGRMLKMLTRMIAPMRILELGTFTGYSALCMAEGMPAGAELHTVEVEDEWEEEIRGVFDSSPYGERMHLHIGDAMEVVPEIGGRWDMVFIDANKRHYLQYYEMLLPRMNPGGYIIADNTLWSGKVTETDACRDAQTRGIMEFNDFVAKDDRVEVSILPIRDGMTLIHLPG